MATKTKREKRVIAVPLNDSAYEQCRALLENGGMPDADLTYALMQELARDRVYGWLIARYYDLVCYKVGRRPWHARPDYPAHAAHLRADCARIVELERQHYTRLVNGLKD